MGHTYLVPVQASTTGALVLRTGRLLSGERVGLAFTSEASLRLTLGPSGQWAVLDGEALRDMLAPLGVEHFRVDPKVSKRPVLAGDRPGPDAVPVDSGPLPGQPLAS